MGHDEEKDKPDRTLHDIVVGILVIVTASAIGLFYNIPTRTAVLETRVDNIEKNIQVQLADIQTRLPDRSGR